MSRLKLITILILILILFIPSLGLTEEAKEEKKEVKEKKVRKLEKIVVTGEREEDIVEAPAAVKVPAVVESITREDLEKITVLDTGDVFRYMPGLYVRKIGIGGTNAPLIIRGNHSQMTARTLVLADGMMLSNCLASGHGNAPRWITVAPEEIERVDVIYGPYSALYSGNALGGAAIITTRFPEKRKVAAKTSYMYHNFHKYKTDYDLDGYTAHVSYGDRFGKFRVFALFDRLENEGHPSSFKTKLAKDGGAPTGNPVSGFDSDFDPTTYEKRFILGEGGVRERTNDLFKIKLGYDINNYTQVRFDWVNWRSDQDVDEVNTYLRDSAGNKVYSGNVDINGLSYKLSDSTFSYSEYENEDDIYGVSFKREPEDGLKIWANASFYNSPKNLRKNSNTVPPDSKHGGAGQVSDADKGWYNFDIRSSYRPLELPILASHTLTAGYHFDRYFTDGETWNASDWKEEVKTTFKSGSEGKTRTHAIFLQDEWDITDKFMLYLGGRYEWWKGFDGSSSRDVSGSRFKEKFEDRKEDYFSPKAAITFRPDEDWSLRLSLAKAYRFPTVGELYYCSISSAGIVTKTNPDLKTEKMFAKDFTISGRTGEDVDVRLSFFENYAEDTIFRQTDVYKDISYYQNVEDVRTRGIEFSIGKKGFMVDGLDAMFNIAYLRAKILDNDNFPASEGKRFPRVAEWTSKAVVSYSPIEDLIFTVAGRYASKPYATLDNIEVGGGGYGDVDDYLVFDIKVSYEFLKHWRASLAVDNLNDEFYCVHHPYPMRMFFAELKWEY